MRFIRDLTGWTLLWMVILSGAARAAFDGAFFAFWRPQWEQMLDLLPEFLRWSL